MKKTLFWCISVLMFVSIFATHSTLSKDYSKLALKFFELTPNSWNTIVTAKPLHDNLESWWARWKMVSNAKESIHLTYYIYKDDIFGQAFLGLLRKKIEEGITVTFMIDARGSWAYKRSFFSFIGSFGKKDYLQELLNSDKTGKSRVIIFNPIYNGLLKLPFGGKISDIVSSNHDKMIIVDNRYILTGGRNIAKEYFTDYTNANTKVFSDSDIYIDDGPYYTSFKKTLVNAMYKALEKEIEFKGNLHTKKDRFGNLVSHVKELEFYRVAMDKWLNGKDINLWRKISYPEDFKQNNYEDSNQYQNDYGKNYRTKFIKELTSLVKRKYYNNAGKKISYQDYEIKEDSFSVSGKVFDEGSVFYDNNELTDSLIALVDASDDKIILQNPYVIITPLMERALMRASERGVKIILHTASPETTDVLLTQVFFIKKWKELLTNMKNLEIWVSTNAKRKVHSKLFVFDGEITMIGTYNLDPLSQNINSEIAICMRSKRLARQTIKKITHPILGDFLHSKQLKIEYVDGKVKELFSPEDTIKNVKLLRKLKRLKNSPILKLIEDYI